MPLPPRGLYEALITELTSADLLGPHAESVIADELRNADAADRLALHVATAIERAVQLLPERSRARAGLKLTRRLIRLLAASTDAELLMEQPAMPGRVLRAIRGRRPDGSLEDIEVPLIPLLDTALLTNSPGEPRVGRQIQAEIASADRIDLIMAFIRRSGLTPLREHLWRHVRAGRPLRVLTTVYTNSTEPEALALLQEIGADVRVSYDVGSTRLHAKAWLFHRDSGYSTAYVGSSNLTHSAQVSGLEWNVRVSGVRNRTVVEKIAAVFDSYWAQPDFEEYDAERFRIATAPRHQDQTLRLSPIEIRLEPFQERLLEEIELSRRQGFDRNLLVSATGTGKTVMAAVDYERLRRQLPRARLLFVAHREEILEQSRATFAHALRDGNFGEMWVGGRKPHEFEHVFASIQSLTAKGIEQIDPNHFDILIIDEFHHSAATSYTALLEHLRPVQLLGLTATPERSDGRSVLDWFGGRIAAELRLWDAIDQHRLVPFAYFGIADELDLRSIPWRRGAGYEVEPLTNLITSTDVWARKVLQELQRHVGDLTAVRALGFCVSVAHARYMERIFTEHGISAVAVWADTPDEQRRRALSDLAAGRINVVFSVDLFNEGVDVPQVDTLLMLRPTDSPLLFLQQLGRGLRRAEGKTVCTVLDFVGQHRNQFRYDRRFRALLGGSRKFVEEQVIAGFPFLPAGCHLELDRVARERVLRSIRVALPNRWPEKVAELRSLIAEQPMLTLAGFLDSSGLELEDVYTGNRSWSALREDAGATIAPGGPHEAALRRACGRLLHVDDAERLSVWRSWLTAPAPPRADNLSEYQRRQMRMLLGQVLDQPAARDMTLNDGIALLWLHPQIVAELSQLFEALTPRVAHVTHRVPELAANPLQVHARYTRSEIFAAFGIGGNGPHVPPWQMGVWYAEDAKTDLFAFTLDKTTGQFSPTTRYRDYAINRELIHWESQSVTRADSETGRRYQEHEARGSRILLFARLNTGERGFYFLGPATYVTHTGERPMAITWKLHYPLPGDLFQVFAAAVA